MNNTKLPNRFRNIAMIVLFLTYASCVSISSFDQYAYAQTTSLKVDALNLMGLAKDDFSMHQESVREFETKLQKTYAYEKNRPKNEITIKLWDKIKNPEGHLLGGFLSRWEKEKKLNPAFISEAQQLVDVAFDEIAGLESKKIKSSGNAKY